MKSKNKKSVGQPIRYAVADLLGVLDRKTSAFQHEASLPDCESILRSIEYLRSAFPRQVSNDDVERARQLLDEIKLND
jgi:hypothetical protein